MSHAPLTSFVPKWLYKKGVGQLTPTPTDIGWANPLTGEQVVAIKGLANPVSYYKPNAMGNSFVDPSWTVPAQVGTVTTSAVTATGFSASWSAPANGGTPITGYNVVVKQGTTVIPSSQVTVTGTTAVVTGLTASTAYTITVAAVNTVGAGTASAAASVTTSAT